MTFYLMHITPDREGRVLSFPSSPSLIDLRNLIDGGWLEAIMLMSRDLPALQRDTVMVDMLVDEDGKSKDLPLNQTASRIVRELRGIEHAIVGNAIITAHDDAGDWASLTPPIILDVIAASGIVFTHEEVSHVVA